MAQGQQSIAELLRSLAEQTLLDESMPQEEKMRRTSAAQIVADMTEKGGFSKGPEAYQDPATIVRILKNMSGHEGRLNPLMSGQGITENSDIVQSNVKRSSPVSHERVLDIVDELKAAQAGRTPMTSKATPADSSIDPFADWATGGPLEILKAILGDDEAKVARYIGNRNTRDTPNRP